MKPKQKVVKKDPAIFIAVPAPIAYDHFIKVNGTKVSLMCEGNKNWVIISPVENIKDDVAYCPHCGGSLNTTEMHESVSRLMPAVVQEYKGSL